MVIYLRRMGFSWEDIIKISGWILSISLDNNFSNCSKNPFSQECCGKKAIVIVFTIY